MSQCSQSVGVWLTGVFVMSDPAGAGARRGPGRDPGEGAELWHHHTGVFLLCEAAQLIQKVKSISSQNSVSKDVHNVNKFLIYTRWLLAYVSACYCPVVQVKEKIIDQVYRNLPYSQRPKVESVALGEIHIFTLFVCLKSFVEYLFVDQADIKRKLSPSFYQLTEPKTSWITKQKSFICVSFPQNHVVLLFAHRVAPWIHGSDPVRPGPNVPEGRTLEETQHVGSLQRRFKQHVSFIQCSAKESIRGVNCFVSVLEQTKYTLSDSDSAVF